MAFAQETPRCYTRCDYIRRRFDFFFEKCCLDEKQRAAVLANPSFLADYAIVICEKGVCLTHPYTDDLFENADKTEAGMARLVDRILMKRETTPHAPSSPLGVWCIPPTMSTSSPQTYNSDECGVTEDDALDAYVYASVVLNERHGPFCGDPIRRALGISPNVHAAASWLYDNTEMDTAVLEVLELRYLAHVLATERRLAEAYEGNIPDPYFHCRVRDVVSDDRDTRRGKHVEEDEQMTEQQQPEKRRKYDVGW